jgi:hypothetical protein
MPDLVSTSESMLQSPAAAVDQPVTEVSAVDGAADRAVPVSREEPRWKSL